MIVLACMLTLMVLTGAATYHGCNRMWKDRIVDNQIIMFDDMSFYVRRIR